jgi:hypothetical protein
MQNLRQVMNRRLVILTSAALLIISICISANATTAGDVDPGAVVTVENYLQSLIAGDVQGIKRTLSPRFLQEKEPVLDSQSYDEFLLSLYKNATFRIVDASPVGTDRVKVDTELTLDGGHLVAVSFILVRDTNGLYVIDQEME